MTGVLFLVALTWVAAAGTSVSGRVTSEDGSPVADAEVYLVDGMSDLRGAAADLIQTRTNEQGEFYFSSSVDRSHVLVYKEGLSLAAAEFASAGDRFAWTKPLPQAIDLQLHRPLAIEVQVQDPHGASLAGHAIRPVGFNQIRWRGADSHNIECQVLLPPPLAKRLASTTDSEGRIKFNFASETARLVMESHSEQWGRQWVDLLPKRPVQKIQLRETGSIRGQLVADDPTVTRQVPIAISVYRQQDGEAAAQTAEQKTFTLGLAEVSTDDQGRFTVPAIAAGRARIEVHLPEDGQWLPPASGFGVQVTAGDTAEISVPVKRGIEVFGKVIDLESGEPVPGVQVAVESRVVTTDDEGRYTALVHTGSCSISLNAVPPHYLRPLRDYQQVDVSEENRQLPDLQLRRAASVQGTVVDEHEQPLESAVVTGWFILRQDNMATLSRQRTVTDDHGRFVLQGMAPGEVALAVRADDRGSLERTVISVPTQESVQLVAKAEGLVFVEGRVVDPSGRPVAGAEISLVQSSDTPSGNPWGRDEMRFPGGPLVTDASGRFRTPEPVPAYGKYVFEVHADGMTPMQTQYAKIEAADKIARIDDLVLQPSASVRGVVLDGQGKPLAGATVWSHGTTTVSWEPPPRQSGVTGADGRFQVEGLHPDAVYVFVESEGFRMGGAVIPADDAEVRVVLSREDEPPHAPPLRLYRRPVGEERELIIRLIGEMVPMLREQEGTYFKKEAVKYAAPHDMELAMSLMPKTDAAARSSLLLSQRQPQEAFDAAAQIEDAYSRSFALMAVAKQVKDAQTANLALAEAVLAAREVLQPERRAVMLANVAEALWDLGHKEQAETVAREGLAIAHQLGTKDWHAFARGCVAEVVALVDPDVAYQLLDTLEDPSDRTRHFGNAAHELAGVRPEVAERFLEAVKDDNNITPYVVRICYRMAPVDLERAMRLAEQVTSSYRGEVNLAHAYGVMAMGLYPQNKAKARELLNQAFQKLDQAKVQGSNDDSGLAIGFVLLAYAAEIDPEQAASYVWRVLAKAQGPSTSDYLPEDRLAREEENRAKLVLVLATFNQFPELRSRLMEPVFRRWEEQEEVKQVDHYRKTATYAAMTLTDPQRTQEWVVPFQQQLPSEERRLIPQAWTTVADILTKDGQQLHKYIVSEVFHLWVIDQED